MIAAPPPGWAARADRAVARGRRLDALIPGILLDSPVSRVGFWWGTAVGWVWGTLWSTGRIERRGGVCVGGCFLTGSADISDDVLRHEAVHARQWRRYGFLMPLLYAAAGRDPLTNRFEILAGLEDGNYVPRGSGPAGPDGAVSAR